MRSLDLASMSQEILKESHVMLLILMLCGTGSSSISAMPLSCDLFPAQKISTIGSVKDPFDQCFVCSTTSTSLKSLSQRLTGGPQEPLGYSYSSLDVSDGKHWKGMDFLRWINTNIQCTEWQSAQSGWQHCCECLQLTGQSIWRYQVLQGSVKEPAMPTVNTMALSISVSNINTNRNQMHP